MNVFLSESIVRGAIVMLCLFDSSLSAFGVPLVNDSNGFEDIPWGTTLSEERRFAKIEEAGRVQIYQRTGQAPVLGTTSVDSIQFTVFEKKFGRVTVRYSGTQTHEEILMYLQSTYGPLDQTPGQIVVGPTKVYAWHGVHTDVTLRFETGLDRGIIFFESRTLPEKLVDETSTTAF